jgi:DNA-binding NarL/FixJ family response regulator
MTRVLIVEDDPQTREFFEQSLIANDALCLAGSVGTVQDALAWLHEHPLDVLLTDLGLPDGSGLEVIRCARRLHPQCEPLVISMFGDDAHVLTSIEAGALGYIHKDSAMDDVARTILDMRAGASPISPMIARRLLTRFQRSTSGLADPTAPTAPTSPASAASARDHSRAQLEPEAHEPFALNTSAHAADLLTPREHEVLALIARGYSYAEIARLQNVTVHTVQSHIKRLYHKLAVSSKTEAVFEATRLGLLER